MTENVTLARAALDAAAAAGAGPVLLASSAAVYGQATGQLSEDMAAPLSDYGHAKLKMEQMAAAHPHPSCVLRIGNVAGADAVLGGWTPGAALDHDADQGTPRRSYVGPAALARLIAGILNAPDRPAVLNVALPGTVAMGDLLDAAGLAWSPRPPHTEVIWDVTLDTSRLASIVDLSAERPGADAIVADWLAWRDRA